MAISLVFGLMSATVLTLLALPAILVVFDDIRRILLRAWNGTDPGEAAMVPEFDEAGDSRPHGT